MYAAVKTALSELDVSKSTQRRLISLLPNGGGAGGGYDESYEVIGGGSGPGGGNIGPVLYGGGGGGGGHGGGEPGGGGGGGGGKPSPKSPSDDVRIEAELDEVDIQTLKDISRRDKVVADLFQVQQWADAISNILKKTVPGPAKILLTVTDSQIEAWGKINKGLNSMGLAKSCIDIGNQEAMAYAENRSDAGRFWNSLKRSRGC